MFLTLGLLFGTLLLITVVGYAVLSAFRILSDSEDVWLLSPLVGLSVLIVITQNLVYLDIPIAKTAWCTLVLFVGLLIYCLYRNKTSLRSEFSHIPYKAYMIAIIVTIIHGGGYLVVGAQDYKGYGWIDGYNYTVIAQFLMDYPYSTFYDKVGNTPSLIAAILHKHERIGQSVFHGFTSVITHQDAGTVYGAVSLVSPFLLSLGFWRLTRLLAYSERLQIVTVLAAALTPAVGILQLKDFYSHSLSLPFLFMWIQMLDLILKDFSARVIALTSLLFAVANSVYTEFTPVLIVLSLAYYFWYGLFYKQHWRCFVGFTIPIIFGFLLIPGYLKGTKVMLANVSVPDILGHVFPYALKVEGLSRLWLPTNPYAFGSKFGFIIVFVMVIITLLAVSGHILRLLVTNRPIALSILLLALLPLVILVQQQSYPYQFYKVLMTVSPLFIFGLVDIMRFYSTLEKKNNFFNNALKLSIALVLILSVVNTAIISIYIKSKPDGLSIINSSDNTSLYSALESQYGKSFLIASDHPYLTAWLSYRGRNSNVWLLTDVVGDVKVTSLDPKIKFPFIDLKNINKENTEIINATFSKYKPETLRSKLAVVLITNQGGYEKSKDEFFVWLGKKADMKIFSIDHSEIYVNVRFIVTPGPSYKDPYRKIRIGNDDLGWREYSFTSEMQIKYPLVVKEGLSNISIETVLPSGPPDIIIPTDPREFFVRITRVEIEERN